MRLTARGVSRRRYKKTVGRWTVWLNGVDVTRDAVSADSRTGRVQLIVRDDEGFALLDESDTLKVNTVHGRVDFTRGRFLGSGDEPPYDVPRLVGKSAIMPLFQGKETQHG